jgi:hypothetical protein
MASKLSEKNLLYIFWGGLDCVGHSFAFVAHLWFLRYVWIQTHSTAVTSWRATDFATHPFRKYDPGLSSRIRIQDLNPDFLPIPVPDPGVKKALDSGSRIPDPDPQHLRFQICSGCRG